MTMQCPSHSQATVMQQQIEEEVARDLDSQLVTVDYQLTILQQGISISHLDNLK
jgi:hypothetical protein